MKLLLLCAAALGVVFWLMIPPPQTLRPTLNRWGGTPSPTTASPTGVLSKSQFLDQWAKAGAAAVIAESADDVRMRIAIAHVQKLAEAAQRSSLSKRSGDYPYFFFYVDLDDDIDHPIEFWGEAARRALPGFRVQPQLYPNQVRIGVFADA